MGAHRGVRGLYRQDRAGHGRAGQRGAGGQGQEGVGAGREGRGRAGAGEGQQGRGQGRGRLMDLCNVVVYVSKGSREQESWGVNPKP